MFRIFLLGYLLTFQIAFSQNTGINTNWLLGYSGGGAETRIDFYSGIPQVSGLSIPMDFRHTHANISDSQGNLLFYTNGYYIADATHDTMWNGSGINPGAYANFVPDGFLIPQGALMLKKPGSNSLYYLFHNSADDYPTTVGSVSYYLYLTVIDINNNGGLGGVILKNYPLITDTLNVGKITACKHANGRDWWVVCHRVNSNMYYKLLVTPYGLPTINSQSIGSFRSWDVGQAKFSPDGTRFAYYHYFNGLDIYDFDRCSGTFSNWIHDTLPYIQGNVGCEFSPNSNVLYVSNILKVYQYDVSSVNVLATKMVVAEWDTFYDPFPPIGTYLCIPQLAPDGKIYITTGNSTHFFHEISNPDLLGLPCNVIQHSLQTPSYNFNTIPNHPNYFLGKIPGSPCDTVTGVGIDEPHELTIKVFPNPSNGNFTIQFPAQSTTGILEIFNTTGNTVIKESIAAFSQYKKINLMEMSDGMYFCKFHWPKGVSLNVSLMKQ